MPKKPSTFVTARGAAWSPAAALPGPASRACVHAGKTFLMKPSTASVADTRHEWLRRFAGAVAIVLPGLQQRAIDTAL